MSHTVRDIEQADFEEEVLQAKVPVLVDFWTVTCGACRSMNPILNELAQEFGDRLKIVKIDAHENVEVAVNYGVQALPTFVSFRHGKVVDFQKGSRTIQAMRKSLEGLLESHNGE